MKHLGLKHTYWNESKVTPCTSVSEGDEVCWYRCKATLPTW
jgi:hypothetical protein